MDVYAAPLYFRPMAMGRLGWAELLCLWCSGAQTSLNSLVLAGGVTGCGALVRRQLAGRGRAGHAQQRLRVAQRHGDQAKAVLVLRALQEALRRALAAQVLQCLPWLEGIGFQAIALLVLRALQGALPRTLAAPGLPVPGRALLRVWAWAAQQRLHAAQWPHTRAGAARDESFVDASAAR